MGRKKRHREEEVESKPYCTYCDKVFQDDKVLDTHQKAKHFKCTLCPKKLSNAGGLVVHMFNSHKQTITTIPNSKQGRESIPKEVLQNIEDVEGGEYKRQKTEEEVILAQSNLITPISMGGLGPQFGYQQQSPFRGGFQGPPPYRGGLMGGPPQLGMGPPILGRPPQLGGPPQLHQPHQLPHQGPPHLGMGGPIMKPQLGGPPQQQGPHQVPLQGHPYRGGMGGPPQLGGMPQQGPYGGPPLQQGPPILGQGPPILGQGPPILGQGPPILGQGPQGYPQYNNNIPPPYVTNNIHNQDHTQPLFPIQNNESSYPQSNESNNTELTENNPKILMIYDDIDISMEEKRARLPQYAFTKELYQKRVNEMNLSIESRIQAMKG